MAQPLPTAYLARHGETAWTITGQHTGLTELPLTERGQRNARSLGERLKDMSFVRVYTSTLLRARQTCEQAGFAQVAQPEPDLVEWNYGDYDGLTTAQIHEKNPDWQLFRDGGPAGESVAQVADRADRVVQRLRSVQGDVLLFSSGHFLRVLAARWLGLEPAAGRFFFLGTATLSAIGYEHTTSEPVLRLWNDARHVRD
jgi:broad specificity phosphatase PhoE